MARKKELIISTAYRSAITGRFISKAQARTLRPKQKIKFEIYRLAKSGRFANKIQSAGLIPKNKLTKFIEEKFKLDKKEAKSILKGIKTVSSRQAGIFEDKKQARELTRKAQAVYRADVVAYLEKFDAFKKGKIKTEPIFPAKSRDYDRYMTESFINIKYIELGF